MAKSWTIWVLIGMCCSVSLQAQIRSSNAGGYIEKELYEGKWHLMGSPFRSFDGSSLTANDLFSDTLPFNSTIFLFDNATKTYSVSIKYTIVGWLPNDVDLTGQPFWLFVEDDGDANPNEIFMAYLSGEIPSMEQSNSPYDNGGSRGYNLLLNPFPVATAWTDTALAGTINDQNAYNDTLYMFNPLEGYTDTAKLTIIGWLPGDVMLYPGDAFWLDTGETGIWEEPKPYAWP